MTIRGALLAAAALGLFVPDRPPLERMAALALLACATLAAVRAAEDDTHAPVAVGLGAASAVDSANAALHAWVLRGGPYFGFRRAAFHIHEALVLASIAFLPVVAGTVLLGARPRRLMRAFVAICAGGLLVALIAGYASVRGLPISERAAWLGARYLGAEVASLAVSAALVWNGGASRARPSPLTEQTVCCLVAGGGALLLVGAWGRGLFGPAYSVHQAGLAAMYFVVAAVHARALRGDGRAAT